MKKFGRESSFMFHQLCLNRGIQLAITEIISKKNLKPRSYDDYLEFSSAEESDQNSDSENEDDVQVEGNADKEFLVNEYILEEQEDLKIVLNILRKIVKLFKKSAVKNCLLQKYVKMDYGRELNLILDSPTSGTVSYQ